MESVDLLEVRVFVTLADELHFGRTAERLGLAPSRVSQLLAGLERKLGVRLFARTSRVVVLTDDGARALSVVRPQYVGLMTALSEIRHPGGEVSGTLRIGYLGAAGGQALSELTAQFEKQQPACRVELIDVPLSEPFDALLGGELQLLATWGPFALPGCVFGPILWRANRVLIAHRDHPLASRESVVWEDLGDYQVVYAINWPRAAGEIIIPATTPAGRPIRRAVGVRSVAEVFTAVARGDVLHATIAGMDRYFGRPDIVSIPIADAAPITSVFVRRDVPPEPEVSAMLQLAARRATGVDPPQDQAG